MLDGEIFQTFYLGWVVWESVAFVLLVSSWKLVRW